MKSFLYSVWNVYIMLKRFYIMRERQWRCRPARFTAARWYSDDKLSLPQPVNHLLNRGICLRPAGRMFPVPLLTLDFSVFKQNPHDVLTIFLD